MAMTLDDLVRLHAKEIAKAVESIKRLIRSGEKIEDIKCNLREEIECAHAVSDMQVLAAFIQDTWE